MAVSNNLRVSRPGGVTLLVVVGVIEACVAAMVGIVLIADSGSAALQDNAKLSSDSLVGVGVAVLIGGVIHLALALLLGAGSQVVRWLFGLITIFNVSFAGWALFSTHGEQRLAAAFSLVFGVVILWILFGSERTDRFFAQE